MNARRGRRSCELALNARWGVVTAALLTAGTALAGCGGAPGSDAAAETDHTHAGGGSVTLWTDALELFAEYPPHLVNVPSDLWGIHLTWIEGGQPVREGHLSLLFRGPGGAREEVQVSAPARPGVFTPTATLTATGTWRVDMFLSTPEAEYDIPVGQLEVFESEEALPHEEEAAPTTSLIVLLKEQQWSMPFKVSAVEEREISGSIRASGEIVAPTGALAIVGAPVSGLVLAGGPEIAPGHPVRAGQTLALLAPTALGDSWATLQGRVARLEREVARAERLYAAEAIAEKRLVETRADLELARAALDALSGSARSGDPGSSDTYTYHLRSPIDGVVAEWHLTPGQRVNAGVPAFTVVDPRTVWLKVQVSATEAEAASAATGASFRVEGSSRVYATDRVVSLGSMLDPDTRTLPVFLSVENPEGSLKIGMLAEARLFTGDPFPGIAVPATAIQDEDGLMVAYVQVGGEAFERRVLELGPSDGLWTLVSSGIQPGEHVVTVGGYQVMLASLGEQEMSDHGHPH